MSGPKGVGYQVVSAEELARRALDAGRARLRVLADESLVLAAQLDELGCAAAAGGARKAAGRHPHDLVGVTSLERDLHDLLPELREQVDRARGAAWTAQARARLAELSVPLRVAFGAAATPTPTESAPGAEGTASLPERVAAALGAASAVRDATLRAELEDLAERVAVSLDSGSRSLARAEASLTALQQRVRTELRRQRREDRLAADRRELILEVADLEGAAADALRADVLAAEERELPRLRSRAEALRTELAAEADRTFVVSRTAQVLRELGYELDEEFAVHALEADPVLAVRPEWGTQHGLQLRFVPGTDTVFTNVVSLGPTTAAADVAVEETSCADIASLRTRLASLGVESTLRHARAPGEVPVERVEASAGARARRTRRRRTAPPEHRSLS